MQVEVVARWSLQIALLERFAVPGAVALVHIHVVHVDRYPHVGRGIGDFVIHVLVDEEVVRLRVAILDVVDAWLTHTREVELHIVVFVVVAPRRDFSLESLLLGAVGLDAEELSRWLHLVVLVQLDDCHLGLFGCVAHLREANVRFPNPVWHGVRLHGPCHHLACLVLRQHGAQHEPSVLCQHSSVVELQFVVAADANHPFWLVHRHHDVVSRFEGQWIDEAVCTSVVVGLETLELARLLCIRTCHGQTGGIAREAIESSIHREGLQPVL